MRKSVVGAVLFLLISSVSYPVTGNQGNDIEAYTRDNKKVILHENGKWEYAKKDVKDTKTAAGGTFTKPKSSTESVKGKKVPYELWYDKTKWSLLSKQLNDSTEFSLSHTNGDAYAMIISERIAVAVEHLESVVLENVQEQSENAHITKSEKRIVNGSEVTFIELRGTIQGIDFVYNYYLYSDKNGTLQITAFTSESLYEEYKNDFENFLNGLVILQKK